ncbi:MAG: flagellar motor switch protein FliN [Blastocatellia bacterium]|nr:flagellar motor switch protein FliN [Blastocatellia bacterium]
MSESVEKQLISAVSASWNEVAPSLLGCSSKLALLASREVSGDGMSAALAVAVTWSWALAVSCSGAISGVLICLFKGEEGEEIERLNKQAIDGIPKPGGRALITSVIETAAGKLITADSGPMTFSPAVYIDLTIDEKRLAAMVGDSIQIGTFSLSLGKETDTQALMLYAPNGSLEIASIPVEAETTKENSPGAFGQNATQGTGSRSRRVEAIHPNMERLLEVELDVVVRFGVTSIPLRDVVRMGVGTMIELDRAVDEPLELLVNGRLLARGEVVVVDGYFGVRITEIGEVAERASIL